jgi:hypothetical protein
MAESAAMLVDEVSNEHPLVTQKTLSHPITNNNDVI